MNKMKQYIFPTEIHKLILIRVLELEYYEKKKKIFETFDKYISDFICYKHKRKTWNIVPENKRITYWSDIFINKYVMKNKIDFPIHPSILYIYCKDIVKGLEF